jgi:hypothetical protein
MKSRRRHPEPEQPRANHALIARLEHELLGIPPEPGSGAALDLALRQAAMCFTHHPVATTSLSDPCENGRCAGCGRAMILGDDGTWRIAEV